MSDSVKEKTDRLEKYLIEHGNKYHESYRGCYPHTTVIRISDNEIHVHHWLPGGGMHAHYDSFVVDNDGKIALTLRVEHTQESCQFENLESIFAGCDG